jgi:hypothetical protein
MKMPCTYSRAKNQDRIERHLGQGGFVLQVLVIILVIAEEGWNNQVGALYTDMVRWCRIGCLTPRMIMMRLTLVPPTAPPSKQVRRARVGSL